MATSPFQDSDGAGDWTVAGLHTEYTPERWQQLRDELDRRDRHHFTKMHVANVAGEHKPYGPVGRLISWWYGR